MESLRQEAVLYLLCLRKKAWIHIYSELRSVGASEQTAVRIPLCTPRLCQFPPRLLPSATLHHGLVGHKATSVKAIVEIRLDSDALQKRSLICRE